MKKISIKDFHGRDVRVGDKVTLLKKAYGFCGIDRAYLIDATYKGKGRWGYEFVYQNPISKYFTCIRVREPQCILFKKKGGK